MEMHQVRYFLALCEEHNFSRAAKRCGVAQPSLSRAIKLLEKEIGGLLFERIETGAILSPLGRALRRYFVIIGQTAVDIEKNCRSGVQPESEGSLRCPKASSCSQLCAVDVWTACEHVTARRQFVSAYGP
jgi:DNA-binding transcriptional LysR family regulator